MKSSVGILLYLRGEVKTPGAKQDKDSISMPRALSVPNDNNDPCKVIAALLSESAATRVGGVTLCSVFAQKGAR